MMVDQFLRFREQMENELSDLEKKTRATHETYNVHIKNLSLKVETLH